MKMQKFIPLILLAVTVMFSMCSKDEDPEPLPETYVGEWETDPFEMAGTPAPVFMAFDFEETSFVTEVKLDGLGVGVLGVKGDITPKEDNVIGISLTHLGTPDANSDEGYDYKSRADNEAEFNAIYDTYVAAFMPKDFDAEYEISGNQMDLIIPVANDTIVLFKK